MQIISSISTKIYQVRGIRVMLDRDLAKLYDTETKILNLAVKRNIARFPEDFMFKLTRKELSEIRSQIIENEINANLRFQIETSSLWGGSRYLPFAFTEQGVAMLSGVLHSNKAIAMHVNIMRAFVQVRKIILNQNDFKQQLNDIKDKIANHEIQLSQIYDAMENLLDEKAQIKQWQDRERIGFQTNKDKES